MEQMTSQAKSVRRGRRAPWYRYSTFWFSLAISSAAIITLLMLFVAPRDPYDTSRMTSANYWLRSIEPGRVHEMDTLRADLNGVVVSNDGTAVWVAGKAGLIAMSTNGGRSWQKETIAAPDATPRLATTDTTGTVSTSSIGSRKKH